MTSSKNCEYYTGTNSSLLVESLHDVIALCKQRRWQSISRDEKASFVSYLRRWDLQKMS